MSTTLTVSNRRKSWILAACLVTLVVAVYWRVLANGFVQFDDGIYINLNEHVKNGLTLDGFFWAFGDISNGNWHPLTWLSHMLDVEWFGLDAGSHHLVNVLWHAANSVVLFAALRRMTGCLWRSALVAALFALHPLRVESVAWAAERKDVLSSFFYFSTLWAYGWYAERPQSWRRYASVAGLLCLGLMSKPSVVTAPFLLLLLDYWPLRRKEPWFALLREKIPLFGLATAVSVATYLGQKQVGAMTAIGNLSWMERIANATVSYARYLGKIAWPHPLAVLYPYERNLPAVFVVGAAVLLGCVTALVLFESRRFRYLPVGWFWFLGTMAPMVGLIQVGWQAYADRYTYIPSAGIFIALVWLTADAFEGQHEALLAVAVTALSALAGVTWSQLPYWHDDMTLFQHAIEVTPANPGAQYHLGSDLVELGRNAEAIPHLQETTRIEPRFYAAHYTLGKAQASEGQTEFAIQSFSEALKLKLDYADACYARATMLAKTGHNPAAEVDYRAALKFGLSDEYASNAHNALGVIHGERGEMEGAITEFQEALRLKPGAVEAQRNLEFARAQGRAGR